MPDTMRASLETFEFVPHMKTILAPIDFSPASDGVVEHAIALARATDARLVLLHVVAPIPVAGADLALPVTGGEFEAAAEKSAERKLRQLQRSLHDAGVTSLVIQTVGDARPCILEEAKRLAADYIVMGSRGHSAFYDLLVGSTASGVLHEATRPVVIVPRGANKARAGDSAAATPAQTAEVWP
jgi:nucleotide-binding universal stress UspA family protein